jgi:hypothetical protein
VRWARLGGKISPKADLPRSSSLRTKRSCIRTPIYICLYRRFEFQVKLLLSSGHSGGYVCEDMGAVLPAELPAFLPDSGQNLFSLPSHCLWIPPGISRGAHKVADIEHLILLKICELRSMYNLSGYAKTRARKVWCPWKELDGMQARAFPGFG